MIIRYTIFLLWILIFSFAKSDFGQNFSDSSNIKLRYNQGLSLLKINEQKSQSDALKQEN